MWSSILMVYQMVGWKKRYLESAMMESEKTRYISAMHLSVYI